MQRKRRNVDDIERNGWMDTYADTITLLLTFFILLYSFSTTDNEKLKEVAEALRGQIAGGAAQIKEVGIESEVEVIETGVGQIDAYDILLKKITEILEENGLTEVVKIREEDAGVVLQLSDSILFDLGKAELKENSHEVLEVISSIIPQIENEVMIQGHTDNIPINSSSYESNWELSTARAVTVVKYFIETKGFDPTRFSATGYGEYRQLVENSNDENRAINRRVDILIVQKKETQL